MNNEQLLNIVQKIDKNVQQISAQSVAVDLVLYGLMDVLKEKDILNTKDVEKALALAEKAAGNPKFAASSVRNKVNQIKQDVLTNLK